MTHDLTQPITILQGDAITRLRELPAESVQCVITSPPYYGLRAYNTVPLVWGSEPSCEHLWGPMQRTRWANEAPGPNGRKKNGAASHTKTKTTGPFCQTCGAWRGELGQEVTVSAFIDHLTMVFREVWRVLKPDGVCWVNIADSYAGSGCGGGVKNKDLCLVPERLAIALQEFGWYVRADVIWAKENGMPESMEDRPTRAHEYVWMLTKSETYYANMEAVAERAKTGSRGSLFTVGKTDKAHPGASRKPRQERETKNIRDVWTINPEGFPGAHFATMPSALAERCILAGSRPGDLVCDPFGGSGTTGMVARRLERRAVLIELNPTYVEMCERRCMQANLWREGQDCEVGA